MATSFANGDILRHPISAQHVMQVSSRRTRGPIATDVNCLERRLPQGSTEIARRMGSGSRFAWPERRLAQHRQRDHVIAMTDGALEHGVLEFELEAAGRADAALGGESSAEHRAAVRQARFAKAAPNELRHREHAVE